MAWKTTVARASLSMFSMASLIASAAEGEVLDWSDLSSHPKLVLRQELRFAEGFVFSAGEVFTLLSEDGVPGLPLISLKLRAQRCLEPQAQTREPAFFTPHPVDSQQRPRRVGVDIKPGCRMEISVEGRDYYSVSFFENSFPTNSH